MASKENSIKIKLEIEGPGSEGGLLFDVTSDQLIFLKNLAEEWNENSLSHASPYIKVTEV